MITGAVTSSVPVLILIVYNRSLWVSILIFLIAAVATEMGFRIGFTEDRLSSLPVIRIN